MTETDDSSGETEDVPAPANSESTAESQGLPARLGTGVVEFYQSTISPVLPPTCRFRPTCSEYTKRAIQRYGLLRGGWLGVKRILKCHPLHPGGHDPVP